MVTRGWRVADPAQRAPSWLRVVAAVGLAALASACAPAVDEDDAGPTPGAQAWEPELTCSTDADCQNGELCESGRCRLARCTDELSSRPPLGTTHFFGVDGEAVVLSDGNFLDAFEPSDGSYTNTLDVGAAVVDVIDGNFDGSLPRGLAIALEGGMNARLELAGGVRQLPLGLVPRAIGAGDVDGDGLDELVALGDVSLAVCDVDQNVCNKHVLGTTSGKDMSVADVDGDGFMEAVLLVTKDGSDHVVVYHGEANAPQAGSHALSMTAKAVAAGDLDGDGRAELAVLEDGGWLGMAADKLHLMSPDSGSVTETYDVDSGSIDLAAGDRDADGRAELALLRDDHVLQIIGLGNGGALGALADISIVVGETPARVAMLDWDGDSAAGELIEGPVMVAGEMVPTVAVVYPPYPKDYAEGVPGLWVGDSKDTANIASNTISLELGMSFGVGFESPLLEAKVEVSLEKSYEVTQKLEQRISVAEYFFVDADPERRIDEAGAVIVSCGCYHRYRYRTADPRGTIGGSDQTIEVLVPAGGRTQMWSSKRYNAMARELGTVPEINIPYRLGDMESYPTSSSTLDGQPIAPDDVLFPQAPTYQASEIAEVEFWLSVGETETNEVAESIQIGVEGSFGVAGVEVGASAAIGGSVGYSIEVGSEALFSGWIPPVPDDPSTPEDEHAAHTYAFVPQVYRHHYQDVGGGDAGFYVVTYTTGR